MSYQCPVCASELQKNEKQYSCSQNHSFDIAREGYVNLLLANQKNSKEPGDSEFMVKARKSFLDAGYYDRLSDALNGLLQKQSRILDLGCGEGFYSDRLWKFFESLGTEVQIFGIDISKTAVREAAKRNKNIEFCVGSNFKLPYKDASFDTVFSVFAPFDEKELKRVLAPGGRFICVRPASEHLCELSALVYEKPQLQGKTLSEISDLKLIEKKSVKYQMQLKTNQDITNLVSMTPYYWHLSEEKKAGFSTKENLSVTADFEIAYYVS